MALAARSILEPTCREDYRSCLIEFQFALFRSLDCSGLIAGQALDLKLPHATSPIPACEISELKTVPLFNLAVLAGSLLANLDANERALLNCFGRQFGLAFQMSDDLLDGELVNPAPFADKLSTLRAAIEPFGAASRPLADLIDYLHDRVSIALTARAAIKWDGPRWPRRSVSDGRISMVWDRVVRPHLNEEDCRHRQRLRRAG